MNIDPSLSGFDRFATIAGGAAVVVFAFLRLENPWVQASATVLGLAMAIAAVGGT